ncbi:YidH family protein [Roseovarius nanhaiticus]|uniref:YidH family protein n=1 Tax=Roseovarius nanhaiticus TaxID=573024 RepID=UPI002491B213|nr:DUF202 domain-containing protein [Roseovarius nanhaiticus]
MIDNFQSHASNERTFLSWVRTVVAIVGFGIGIARLGNAEPLLLSEMMMLSAGAAVILIAWIRMHFIRKRIDDPRLRPDGGAPAEIFLLMLLASLFVLLGSFAIHVT